MAGMPFVPRSQRFQGPLRPGESFGYSRFKEPLVADFDIAELARKILEMAEVDKGLKEPLRRRLKEWQKGVIAAMKAQAPDDPETGMARIEDALKAKAPVISRKRQAIYASFVTDSTYLNRHIYDTYKGKRGRQSRPAWAGAAWSLVQHEDLGLRHRKGGAKYMERPFKAGGERIAALITAAFEEVSKDVLR